MAIYSDLLNIVGKQTEIGQGLANIEHLKANTALQLVQGKQAEQRAEIDAATRALMLADTSTSTPQPTSTAASEDAQKLPFSDEYKAVQANVAQSQKFLQIAQKAGDIASVEKWGDNVREASNNLATLGVKRYDALQKLAEQKANLAAGVNDQASLNEMINTVGDQFGAAAKAKVVAALADPLAGVPVYNEATQRKLAAMSNQFTEASKQASEKRLELEYRRKIAEDEQQAKNQTEIREQARRNESLARETLEGAREDRKLSREQRAADHEDLQTQRAQTAARQIQNAYTAESKDFETKRDYFTTAAEYMRNPDGTVKPSSARTPTGDQALTDAYIAMIHPNYRGTVYELRNIDQLAGVPARVFQGIKNVALGKELPGNVAEEMFTTMSNQMKSINATQQKKEASYMEQIKQLPEGKVDPKVWIRKKSIGGDVADTPSAGGLPAKADLQVGTVYPLPNGKQGKWDGSQFVIQSGK